MTLTHYYPFFTGTQIKYMWGDTLAGGVNDPAGSIDHYIHTDYEDI